MSNQEENKCEHDWVFDEIDTEICQRCGDWRPVCKPSEAKQEPKYQSTDRFEIKGRGTVFSVVLDRDCENFDWLIGHKIILDGKEVEVAGVESYAIVPKRKGSVIGLLIKPDWKEAEPISNQEEKKCYLCLKEIDEGWHECHGVRIVQKPSEAKQEPCCHQYEKKLGEKAKCIKCGKVDGEPVNIKTPEEIAKEICLCSDNWKTIYRETHSDHCIGATRYRITESISAERVKASEWEMSCNSIAIKHDQTMKILSAERNANLEKINALQAQCEDSATALIKRHEKIRELERQVSSLKAAFKILEEM